MVAANVDSGPWTVSRLLAWTRDFLARQRIESPRLCAELLLAHAMGCPRIRLYTQYEAVPGEDVLRRYREAVKAAAAGTPIAYLTGVKEFFALEFEVTPAVLTPRPETEVLVERTVRLLRESEPARPATPAAEETPAAPTTPAACRILDLGTGSGCIAVALAKNLATAAIFASDISAPAVEVARRNAARHGVAERIEFRVGDLFEPWSRGPEGEREGAAPADPALSPRREHGKSACTGATCPGSAPFDVIVSNPPYIATAPGTPVAEDVRKYEPAEALFAGPEGLDILGRIVDEAQRWLVPGGHLLMEMAFDQAHKVCARLSSAMWQEVTTYRDAAGHERVVHARRPAEAVRGV